MKRIMVRVAQTIPLFVFLLGISACGLIEKHKTEKPDISDTVRLSMWGWIDDYAAVKYELLDLAIDEFNTTNPYHVIVEYESFSEEFKTKISTETAANNMPDLFFTWEAGSLEPFVTSGNALSLDQLIAKHSFDPNVLEPVTFNGHVYAMPLAQTALVVYYNKEIFSQYGIEIPSSTENLLEATKRLRTKGVIPFALGNKDVWPAGLILGSLIYRHGGELAFKMASTGEMSFVDSEFLQAARDFERFVQAGAFERDAARKSQEEARRMVMAGEAAMWVMGSWEIPFLNNERDDLGYANKVIGQLGVFNWPSVPSGKTDQNNWIIAPDFNIAISRDVKHKEAAVAFLLLLSSEKYQKIASNLSLLPATQLPDVVQASSPLAADLLLQINQSEQSIIFPDRLLGQQTIGGELNGAAMEMLLGIPADEAMERLEKRVADMR